MKLKPQSDNHKKILEEFREKFTYLRDYSEQEHGLKGIYTELNPDEIESFLLQKLQEERERIYEEIVKYQEKCNEYPMVLPHITKESEKYWNEGYDKALSYVLEKLKSEGEKV